MYDDLWFQSLNKPFLSPPDFVFAPVWTILYVMIALSFIFYIKDGISKEKIVPLFFFFFQLILNFSWSPVFFILHNIALALVIIVFMWITLFTTVILFYKSSKKSALFLIPYFLWVSFALYLNSAYYILN